jgi:hypothetical protein
MRARLRQAYQDAEKGYCEQNERGVKFGYLSTWRHSFKKTQAMEELETNLANSKTDLEALSIALGFIINSTMNRHSFSQYFISHIKRLSGDNILDENGALRTNLKGKICKWDDSKEDLSFLLDKIKLEINGLPLSDVDSHQRNKPC